jgi:hypothetical protein
VTEPPRTCRHCGGEIIPRDGRTRYCKGWKHVAYLHYGPVGPHYCEGRSVNPMAEPAEMAAEGLAAADLDERG